MKFISTLLLTTGIILLFSVQLWSSDNYHKGYDLMSNKKYSEAAETLEKAVSDYPDDFNLQYLIGYCYFHDHKISKAIAPLEKSLTLTSKNEEINKAAFLLGTTYYKLQKPDHFKSRNAFIKAAKANPKDFNAHYFAGKVSMKLDDYSGAIKHLQQALSLNPKHSGTYLLLGLSYRNLEPPNLDKSVESLEKTLTLNPKDEQAPLYLTLNYLEKGKFQDAIRAGLIAIQQTPKTDLCSAYSYLGQAELALKEYSVAIKHLQKVLELCPSIPSVYFNLGQAFEAVKSYDKALINFLEAHERDPKNCDYIYKVGHAYELIKKDCEAVKWYKKCLECPTTGDACKERLKWSQKRCEKFLQER